MIPEIMWLVEKRDAVVIYSHFSPGEKKKKVKGRTRAISEDK